MGSGATRQSNELPPAMPRAGSANKTPFQRMLEKRLQHKLKETFGEFDIPKDAAELTTPPLAPTLATSSSNSLAVSA
eukprot:CAMPEP_0181441944 /NCGR_PEP_ID=MMETSP1110-20121109/23773_1 /TAXON_ID=174948 /ORGANISM="Symbiodinium sp., Strain CCMP421" /LENGTH=76 /DNA_ID=CAMNT_0023565853 /DNA_START=45 /DNA_END=275 /DNA_ORIENTATION=+